MGQNLPLTKFLEQLGAKLGCFSGYTVPLEFEGAKAEHLAVRLNCGVFDVSHMGLIEVKRADKSLPVLKEVLAGKIIENKASYVLLLNSEGKILDDLLLYPHESLLLCCNAVNKLRVIGYLASLGLDARLLPVVILAVQGPKTLDLINSTQLMQSASGLTVKEFIVEPVAGVKLISRTGYTGEDGIEVFLTDYNLAKKLYSGVIARGAKPCGLIARDTLRLEWGLPLYGNELDDSLFPNDCGLPKSFSKKGAPQRFFTKYFICEENFQCIPRKNWLVKDLNLKPIGIVTSGAKTPCLPAPVGFVRLEVECSHFILEHGNRAVKAEEAFLKRIRALIQSFKAKELQNF